MRRTSTNISQFLGLMTQYDASQVPFGAVLSCKNMAQFELGRLRRIHGISQLAKATVDAGVQIPLLFVAEGLGAGGTNRTIAVMVDSGATKIYNYSAAAEVTGAALGVVALGSVWSYARYAQKHILAGGGNTIKEINADTTYIALAGTSVPTGDLVIAFLDRLYVAGIAVEPDLVRFSGVLDTVFNASSIINTKEIPGAVTALAVNANATDQEGIETDLLIFKRNAIWAWNETRKDVVSGVTGTRAPRTVKNTPAGTVFLGETGSTFSVFRIPLGAAGEPQDIGEGLFDILNGASPLQNPVLAHAIVDGRFYKLFFSSDGTTTSKEVWLDVKLLAATGNPVWYGVHSRGALDASVVYRYPSGAVATRLELANRGGIGVYTWFTEKASGTSGFTDTNGSVLVAEIDLPLNVEPINDEKVYDVAEFQIAKEANLADNAVVVELISEGTSYGNISQIIYDAYSGGISRPLVPLYPSGSTGLAGRDARLKITHSLDKRLDLLGAIVQYYAHEEALSRVKGKISG